MKILIIYSNPKDQPILRLDKEDRAISKLKREYEKEIETHHASDVNDVHSLMKGEKYDVIQFSGHGSPKGIYLEKCNYENGGDLISAMRIVNLINLSEKLPSLVIFLCCYSNKSVEILSDAAPFVITTDHEIGDRECIEFVKGFYESFLEGNSIQSSFKHAINCLLAKQLPVDNFRLNRRYLLKKNNGLYVESKPSYKRDSLLIDLSIVSDKIAQLDIDEAEFCHLISRKLAIHHWIFDVPRDNAILPIGKLLFGEFSWEDSKDVVVCTNLMRFKGSLPPAHWKIWSRVLLAYNDLAACAYRSTINPSSPKNKPLLQHALELFENHIQRFLISTIDLVTDLGFIAVEPHIEWIKTNLDAANMYIQNNDLPKVVASLELSLSNFHEIVTILQPPEEII